MIDDVKEFLSITNSLQCDVDLIKGRYIIDAKSLMGVFSVDISSPVEIIIHSDDEGLIDLFRKWEIN